MPRAAGPASRLPPARRTQTPLPVHTARTQERIHLDGSSRACRAPHPQENLPDLKASQSAGCWYRAWCRRTTLGSRPSAHRLHGQLPPLQKRQREACMYYSCPEVNNFSNFNKLGKPKNKSCLLRRGVPAHGKRLELDEL